MNESEDTPGFCELTLNLRLHVALFVGESPGDTPPVPNSQGVCVCVEP